MATDNIQGLATRTTLPNRTTEGQYSLVATDGRGAMLTSDRWPGRKNYSLPDCAARYFATTNGTPIITQASQTAFVATTPFMVITNNATEAQGTHLYLDTLELTTTTHGAGATDLWMAIKVDGQGVSRYTSGGSTLTSAVTTNHVTATSNAVIKFGAITAPAASANVKNMGYHQVRQGLGAAGDKYILDFGGAPENTGVGQVSTTVGRFRVPCEGVVLAPQSACLLYNFASGHTTAYTFEVNFSYWEF